MNEENQHPEATGPPGPDTPPPEEYLDHQLRMIVRRSRRYVWVIIAFLAVTVIGLTAAVIWLIVNTQNSSSQTATEIRHEIAVAQRVADHRWCATMGLLTSHPVAPPKNPAGNPSREQNYLYYADFLILRKQFGCLPLAGGELSYWWIQEETP